MSGDFITGVIVGMLIWVVVLLLMIGFNPKKDNYET